MALYDYTLYSAIRRNARLFGDRIALIFGNQSLTHRQFLEKTDRLSAGLLKSGVAKGDRIGVLSHNCLEYIYLYGAAARIGAIMLPINWRLSLGEIEYVLRDGTPTVLIVGSGFQTTVNALLSNFEFIRNRYSIDTHETGFSPFEKLLEQIPITSESDVTSIDPYVIIHTAAIQGKPRGAVLTHQNILFANLLSSCLWHLSKEDVHIVMLPLFHLAEISMALSVIQAGGSSVILPKFDADLAAKHIHEHKVTILGEFAPMLEAILTRAKEANYDLSSLRIAIGLDRPDIVKRFEEVSGATFWIGYGQTETSGIGTTAPYFEKPGSAGVPASIADVEIMDEQGKILCNGKTGEIVVRGPIVFKGYWNLGQETKETLKDGWHHTGDLGYFDNDGYLWYKGRAPSKQLIKPGGENVYPAEVEKVLLEHPSVEAAVVIGVPDPQWGEAIKAICVLKKDRFLSAYELTEFVVSKIARYKKPKYIAFVPNLPRNEDGSIDRRKVKADYGRDINSPKVN